VITFGSGSTGTLVLVAESNSVDPKTVLATFNAFVEGDTIDLAGVTFPMKGSSSGLQYSFDSVTGTLVIEKAEFGSSSTPVGTLVFNGIDPADANSFSFTSDGKNGTDLTLDVPPPDLSTLAALEDETYNLPATWTTSDIGLGADGYGIEDGTSDVAGLLAVAYQDNNQVVLAFRGTDPKHYWQLGKNVLADASWAPGTLGLAGTNPNSILANEVADAANFLYKVRREFPNAVLTLVGHSLGGAIAQLLGEASGYTAIGFNAPGAAQFAGPLSSAMAPAVASKVVGRQPGVDENIRMYGDQVSLAETSIGPQYTLPQMFPNDWYNALNNHSMDSIVKTIERSDIRFTSGVTPNVDEGVRGSALPLSQIVRPIVNVLSSNPLVTQFAITFPVATAVIVGGGLTAILAALIAVDPSNSASTELVGDTSSPNFSGFELPNYAGVVSYSYSLQVDGSWQASQTVLPGGIIQTPAQISLVRRICGRRQAAVVYQVRDTARFP
jgi:hypothetical protein